MDDLIKELKNQRGLPYDEDDAKKELYFLILDFILIGNLFNTTLILIIVSLRVVKNSRKH